MEGYWIAGSSAKVSDRNSLAFQAVGHIDCFLSCHVYPRFYPLLSRVETNLFGGVKLATGGNREQRDAKICISENVTSVLA